MGSDGLSGQRNPLTSPFGVSRKVQWETVSGCRQWAVLAPTFERVLRSAEERLRGELRWLDPNRTRNRFLPDYGQHYIARLTQLWSLSISEEPLEAAEGKVQFFLPRSGYHYQGRTRIGGSPFCAGRTSDDHRREIDLCRCAEPRERGKGPPIKNETTGRRVESPWKKRILSCQIYPGSIRDPLRIAPSAAIPCPSSMAIGLVSTAMESSWARRPANRVVRHSPFVKRNSTRGQIMRMFVRFTHHASRDTP